MSGAQARIPRLRQAVLAADDLDAVSTRLREELRLGVPFRDPAVDHFGLQNAVFALGDTFLEVVSPTRPETAAGRLLERRGGDCGYIGHVRGVRAGGGPRTGPPAGGTRGVRGHARGHRGGAPASRGHARRDRGPQPSAATRLVALGGPDWRQRSTSLRVGGATIAISDPAPVEERWQAVLDAPPASAGVRFVADSANRGLIEIAAAALTATAASR